MSRKRTRNKLVRWNTDGAEARIRDEGLAPVICVVAPVKTEQRIKMNQLRRCAVTTVLALGGLLSFSVQAEILTGRIVGISDGDSMWSADSMKLLV
jgi:hypothetical protein